MLEFSFVETLMIEMALKDYMRRDMCQSDKNICEQAYMKLCLSKKGQRISDVIRSMGVVNEIVSRGESR